MPGADAVLGLLCLCKGRSRSPDSTPFLQNSLALVTPCSGCCPRLPAMYASYMSVPSALVQTICMELTKDPVCSARTWPHCTLSLRKGCLRPSLESEEEASCLERAREHRLGALAQGPGQHGHGPALLSAWSDFHKTFTGNLLHIGLCHTQ